MWNAYGPSGARRALCVTVGWVALSASIVGFRVRSERGWCRAPSWVIIPDSCSSSSPSSRTSSSGGLRLYYYVVISQIATGRELLLAGLRVVRRRARGTRASRYFPRGGAPRGEWRPSSEGSLRAWRPGAKSGVSPGVEVRFRSGAKSGVSPGVEARSSRRRSRRRVEAGLGMISPSAAGGSGPSSAWAGRGGRDREGVVACRWHVGDDWRRPSSRFSSVEVGEGGRRLHGVRPGQRGRHRAAVREGVGRWATAGCGIVPREGGVGVRVARRVCVRHRAAGREGVGQCVPIVESGITPREEGVDVCVARRVYARHCAAVQGGAGRRGRLRAAEGGRRRSCRAPGVCAASCRESGSAGLCAGRQARLRAAEGGRRRARRTPGVCAASGRGREGAGQRAGRRVRLRAAGGGRRRVRHAPWGCAASCRGSRGRRPSCRALRAASRRRKEASTSASCAVCGRRPRAAV